MGHVTGRTEVLYLENVHRDVGDTDRTLSEAVRNHAKKHDFTIKSVSIVTNRYCDEMVGCRIQVASPDVQKALTSNKWPDNVTCRRWERRPPRRPPVRMNTRSQLQSRRDRDLTDSEEVV